MGIKDMIAKVQKERAEKQAYNKIVAKRNLMASRQAYATESEKQARLAAQRKAVARYSRPGGAGAWGTVRAIASGVSNVAGSAVKARPMARSSGGTRKVVSYVKKGKGYKKVTRTVRTQARASAPRQMQQPALPWSTGSSSNGGFKEATTKDVFGW